MIAQREAFGNTLVELARTNRRGVSLDVDLSTSTRTDIIAETLPESFFQMGIAEQNMFGVAA